MGPFSIEPFLEIDIDAAMGLAGNAGLSFWSESGFRSHLASNDTVSLKLVSANLEFAGFLVARFVPGTADRPDAELLNIAVDGGNQRLGGGRRLMCAFLKACVEAKVDRVWLDVRESNERAIRFYASFGFGVVQKRKAAYSNPVEDAIIMLLELSSFSVTET